ncbi:hypothetical protein ACLB2K_041368 [Fragaria x ananassa]
MEFGDCKLDYFGKGVLAVAGNVNDIIGPALIENDPVEQILVDNYMVQQLERFRNEWGWCKQELGENAIPAVSLYVRKAGANLAGNKTLILHVPTKYDGSSITLLTKDICNNVWVSSGALKLVQSEFRTAFVLVLNKPTDIVDDNYENIQAHSKRVLEFLLKKWKSRVIAKTQSQARLVQWFILSLQLCHCKRKVPTLACTLNACSNGNMLCLRLEINLEKMSLCLAEKWEKRDRIVKQMFDGNWERWKFIVIAIKNESGTEELHVESLLAVLGVWERIFSRREDKDATIVDQNYSCASCFQERDCFVVLKLVLLPLLKPLQLQSWPTTEDKLKQGGISDKFCEGLKLLWLLFFSDVMSILLLFNKGVIASGMSTKILCECLESLFDVLDKFGNVMATYHKLSLGALLSQWSSNQVIMRKKTKSCAASLASRLSDDLLAKAAIEVVQHFSNSNSSSFTSSPDGFGVCFEDFNAELWFLSLLATMQSTVQFPKYSKIIWSLDTLAYCT